MIKVSVNIDNGTTNKCYQVNGTYYQNGKEIKTLFFVYADNEKSAKDCLLTYKLIRPIKYNLTTLANAQVAYKKQFGVDVELDSVEFVDYTRK